MLLLITVTSYKHPQVRNVNNTGDFFKWWLWGAFSVSVPMGWLLSPSYIWEVILGRSLSDSIVITYKIFQFFQSRAGCGTDESSSPLPLCPRLVSGAWFCVSRRWTENRWFWLEWDSAQQSCSEVSVGDQGWVSEDHWEGGHSSPAEGS